MFCIDGKQGRLEVAYDRVKSPRQDIAAVICHPHPLYQGNMHNKIVTTISRAMKAFEIESYRFNYRGVGKSQGKYGEGLGELEDLVSICEWINQNSSIKKVILCGFSFGGAIAYKGASNLDNTAALITIAPAVDRFDLTKYSEPNCPWLLVQGIDDDTVSPAAVFEFVSDKVNSDLTLIKMNEVGHFFHGKLVDLKKSIENFISSIINDIEKTQKLNIEQ